MSDFFYYGFDRVFVSNKMLGLPNQNFQQKEEEVFCGNEDMSELTCQGEELLSNCSLNIPFLMFPCMKFTSHGQIEEAFCKIMQLGFSLN